jgi:hypothetical protein
MLPSTPRADAQRTHKARRRLKLRFIIGSSSDRIWSCSSYARSCSHKHPHSHAGDLGAGRERNNQLRGGWRSLLRWLASNKVLGSRFFFSKNTGRKRYTRFPQILEIPANTDRNLTTEVLNWSVIQQNFWNLSIICENQKNSFDIKKYRWSQVKPVFGEISEISAEK